MNTFLQLWDTSTGNLVTEFETENEAVEALRRIRAEDGDEALLDYALVRFHDDRPTVIAKERDLILYLARARAA